MKKKTLFKFLFMGLIFCISSLGLNAQINYSKQYGENCKSKICLIKTHKVFSHCVCSYSYCNIGLGKIKELNAAVDLRDSIFQQYKNKSKIYKMFLIRPKSKQVPLPKLGVEVIY